MSNQINPCPVCGHTSFTIFLEGKDYFLSGEEFRICRCEHCGFLVTDPSPPEETIGRYYESNEYISHDAEEKKLLNRVYKMARSFTIRSKYRLVKKHSFGEQLLDIGCGTGEFLNFCRQNGFNCSGIEPNQKAREHAVREYHLNIRERIMFTPEENVSFDCITMWHVLEHIHDLNGTLAMLKAVLKPKGTLILALPNPGSWDARHYKKHWAAFDLPRHLYHFLPDHVSRLAEKHGFKLTKTLPQFLDAFYISMLSEKNRNGKNDPVKGFLNGFRSNLSAINSEYGYSSHIYILSANIS
jgi:2-polyprenyl-3-methyl-5-hydroxy-6-metoxy-1,4-benzoquinol methylase